jgi:hypothetical protein
MCALMMCSQFLNGFKCESKLKTTEEQKIRACSMIYNILEGCAGASGWDYEK